MVEFWWDEHFKEILNLYRIQWSEWRYAENIPLNILQTRRVYVCWTVIHLSICIDARSNAQADSIS